jgi:hypothetical protein
MNSKKSNTQHWAPQRQARQRAYLLRCWQEGRDTPGAASRWRYSVEEVLRKQPRRGFDDLESLFSFLRAEIAEGEDQPKG